MRRAEREAWEQFKRWIDTARPALDGCAPVTLIAMPIERVDADGAVQVRVHADGRIIWPADFPIEDRGPLLEQLARAYRVVGGVRR